MGHGDIDQVMCWLQRDADLWRATRALATAKPNQTLIALLDASRVITGKEPGGGPCLPLSAEDEARIRRVAEGKD
jgi:hypothetical protein